MFLGRKKKQCLADTSAIVVAAGNATRMEGIDKQFAEILGVPVLIRSLQALDDCPSIGEIIVVTREDMIPALRQMIQEFEIRKVSTLVTGGDTRQQSVYKGLAEVSREDGYLAIHDGARPLVRPEDVECCIAVARESGAATLGVPVKDTIKRVDEANTIVATPERKGLFSTQTPQVFLLSSYKEAVKKALFAHKDYTDDCQLLEESGYKVQMVPGSYDNIKITTPDDLAVAAGILSYQYEGMEE